MIWAGIHYGGKTPLVVPDGNVNAAAYRDILEFHCLPYARRVYGHNIDSRMTTLDRTGKLQ